MVFLAVFAPVISPYDPNATDMSNMFATPGQAGHLFGTDSYGRDLLSRIIYGARISIFIAIGGTIVGAIIGVLLGLVAGFFGGAVDSIIMRVMDGMMAFPFILLALILMTILGQGDAERDHRHWLWQTSPTLPACGARPGARGEERGVLQCREGHWRLPCTHSLQAHLCQRNVAGHCVLHAQHRERDHLGGRPVVPSAWRAAAHRFLGRDSSRRARARCRPRRTSPTISGIFILLTVLGFNLLGDGIRDVFDPKQKR
jgi:peptide/nickel transport system permease protein